jgi:predicted transcriptional regulator
MRSREIRCLQALNRQQPLSTRKISQAAGLAYNTASKALYSMARRRCVTWARVLIAKGRPEKLYWLDDRMNPKIPDDEYLQAVGDEWTSAAGVADTIGRSVSACKRRLAQLHEEGRLERMKSPEQIVGRKAWLYRRPRVSITVEVICESRGA